MDVLFYRLMMVKLPASPSGQTIFEPSQFNREHIGQKKRRIYKWNTH